jgi:hypothetical protein
MIDMNTEETITCQHSSLRDLETLDVTRHFRYQREKKRREEKRREEK